MDIFTNFTWRACTCEHTIFSRKVVGVQGQNWVITIVNFGAKILCAHIYRIDFCAATPRIYQPVFAVARKGREGARWRVTTDFVHVPYTGETRTQTRGVLCRPWFSERCIPVLNLLNNNICQWGGSNSGPNPVHLSTSAGCIVHRSA
jgi:hypothetical protein